MIWVLERKVFTPESTQGELFCDGVFQCYTLEDTLRPDGVKIPGKTCIPAGRYQIAMTKSPRFGRILPLLIGVPQFEGVRIHAGNKATHTEGCILVGRTKGVDQIGESTVALDVVLKKMESRPRGEALFIEVKNGEDAVWFP